MTLEEKILNGECLKEHEVREAFYDLPCVLEEENEARRWSRWVSRVVEVDGNFYLVEGDIGLTECQEDYFEPRVLKRVEVYTEMVSTLTWRYINENHSN